MGEILAVGLTHYPPLTGHDDHMTAILKRMLRNPALPEKYRQVEGWPAAMRAEWGADEGTSTARRHRAQLLEWFNKVRIAIDEFKPDFILMWGDDQYENFKEDVIPPYCIYAYDTLEFSPPPANVWGDPPERKFHLSGHPAAARYLATHLLEAGFDPAYAYRPLHHPLGHAFRNAILYLDYERRGFDYPVLPFAVNCYGRRVISQRGGLPNFDPRAEIHPDPPSPSPQRLFDLGAATARILAASPWRVVLMASSGWSHAFLTAKNYFLYPDTPADQVLYDALRAGDYETWRSLPLASIEDSGQHEILNWMCLTGALKQLGLRPQASEFFTTWVLNSSKCFMVAGPH
ncbi:MAG: extradiol ring-cleavage dioxygenase [Candidatus Binataceae bacterium]